MNELENFKEMARAADAQRLESRDITAGVFQAIERRKRRSADSILLSSSIATGLAILISAFSIQLYSLDWQMASSCWPKISQHVLFQDSP